MQAGERHHGLGHLTLWSHEHLNPQTPEWLKQEFAWVPLSFFRQMLESLSAGYMPPVEGYRELPQDVALRRPQMDARFVFMTGRGNRCVLAESQQRSYEALSRYRRGYHSLHVLPGYGHRDGFLGKNAPWDVFPPHPGRAEPAPPGEQSMGRTGALLGVAGGSRAGDEGR